MLSEIYPFSSTMAIPVPPKYKWVLDVVLFNIYNFYIIKYLPKCWITLLFSPLSPSSCKWSAFRSCLICKTIIAWYLQENFPLQIYIVLISPLYLNLLASHSLRREKCFLCHLPSLFQCGSQEHQADNRGWFDLFYSCDSLSCSWSLQLIRSYVRRITYFVL